MDNSWPTKPQQPMVSIPSFPHADSSNGKEPKDPDIEERRRAAEALGKAFQAVLEREEQALREQFSEGFNPMEAQARALLWLLALQDFHMKAVKEAIASNKAEMLSGWAEDLGKLSATITILETIQPVL